MDRCCIVASLLASDPAKSDTLGRRIQGDLYDIFQRQREEAVEPVVKEDVAELLRRHFFTPESIKDRDAFRPHVQAALAGVLDPHAIISYRLELCSAPSATKFVPPPSKTPGLP